MNLNTYLERLGSLTINQLKHARSLVLVEIQNYTRAIENYPPDRMKKFGEPYMRKLQNDLEKIDAELAKSKS